MSHLFDISYLITTYGYLGIFIIVFLESGIFFALPGDSLLFTAGILAAAGILKIQLVIPLIFIATLLGGIFGYYIGVNLEKLRRFSFLRKTIKDEYVNKTHGFFEKYGKMAIIFSRFVPIVRTFAPIVAGIGKMNYRAFLRSSLVSSILWSTIITLLGFFLGHAFPQIKDYLTLAIIIILLVSLIPVILPFLKIRKV